MAVLMYIKNFNERGNVTTFQAGKVLRRVKVINFLNFQFMNFWNSITFRRVIPDVVFCMWQHCFDLSYL